MQEATQSALSSWESYYVIVGSSGAALTGLQFVVITLAAELRRRRDNGSIDAYATPTVVHFCVALFIAAVLSAPWTSLSGAALALGCGGAFGIGYVLIATRRAMRQTDYTPVFEDWLWHTIFPIAAYLTLLASALILVRHTAAALFAIGAAALLLLFIGIHNSWDTVTYLTLDRLADFEQADAAGAARASAPSPWTAADIPGKATVETTPASSGKD
jgi:hypothetical protein